MKTIICIISMVILAGCASTPRVKAPTDNAILGSYRKTVEVIGIQCMTDRSNTHRRGSYRNDGEVMVVESATTGERFMVHGCLGKTGERFKISY